MRHLEPFLGATADHALQLHIVLLGTYLSKAALKIFIESVNVELEKGGSDNRILNVSPGSIAGTSFNQAKTNLAVTTPLAQEIISHLKNRDDLFIPRYEEVFRNVLERYQADFRAEGRHSYEYKLNSGRVK